MRFIVRSRVGKYFYPRSPCGERLCCIENPVADVRHFYPRSPCGERRCFRRFLFAQSVISIHALLAESDSLHRLSGSSSSNFYPRSPCGERRGDVHVYSPTDHFYPRSPCGERRPGPGPGPWPTGISIHALLAESDPPQFGGIKGYYTISIHALLAESDEKVKRRCSIHGNFYPRSPCGERRALLRVVLVQQVFLSTLSLRRATPVTRRARNLSRISIHALLAESDPNTKKPPLIVSAFLSTLSLRRATLAGRGHVALRHHFYPRSPCGERPQC